MTLNQSCLSKEEQEVYNLLFKYTGEFSFRYEIGACPNNEVDLQVIDRSPFFISRFHVNKEDKPMADKEG